ncbi:28S ribosomal protein S22, mitochondrial [Chamberlinius hualienensis]
MALIVKNNVLVKTLTNFQHFRNIRTSCYAYCTQQNSKGSSVHNRDPAPYFFNPKVQELMQRLTGLDLHKVFRTCPLPVKLKEPTYRFMTESQLKKAFQRSERRAVDRLQFPPMLKEREEINVELSYDPELQGFQNEKFVFIDISQGFSNKNRTIVVREPDGSLRQAFWEERDRMNTIYFPANKKKLGMPRMFLDENLEVVLNNEEYEFILDRACLQFEPDSSEFIKAVHKTFDRVDSKQKYDVLHSTRHYGPLVFYLAFYTNIDNLLSHLIKNHKIMDAADAVRLYHLVNSEKSKSVSKVTNESTPIQLVKEYIKLDAAKNKPQLELLLQSYEELEKSNQQCDEAVKHAHGQI